MDRTKNIKSFASYLGSFAGERNLRRENKELRERLAKFTEASLYVTQNLDLQTVLENCLRAACALTGAQHGAVVTFDEAGKIDQSFTVGISPEERGLWRSMPKMHEFFQHLNALVSPLRLDDFPGYATSLGFPGEVLQIRTFLGMPLRYHGAHVGSIYLAAKAGGKAFTQTDEETLLTFAIQTATAIANANRYEEEQRAKADLEALINISPVGVLVFDANSGAVMSINEEAKRIQAAANRGEEDLLDVLRQATVRRLGESEFAMEGQRLTELLKRGEQIRGEEMTLTFADGEKRTIIVNAAPILGDSGEVSSVVVNVQDSTHIADQGRLRADFLKTVGNELRAPLSTIKGSVATLLDPSTSLNSMEFEQFLSIIDQQADLMRSQINSLIELTRIESGMLAVHVTSMDVVSLANEVAEWHRHGKSTATLEVSVPTPLPNVTGDKKQLGQVLQNLLTLTERYATDTTAIRISAARDDVFVAITVSANGLGVPASGLSYLFRRISPSARDFGSKTFSGEGLDFAVCRGIVEAHGGRIWTGIDPSSRGMNFTFTVPIADEPPNALFGGTARPDASAALSPSDRIRVLVAVDDPGALRNVRNTLAGAGYSPIPTFGLDDIDRLIQTEHPHAFLLDLTRAEARGYTLMQRVTTEYGVPTIALSTQGSDEHIVRAFEMGAVDYIVKPFSPSELVARVKASVQKRALPHHSEFMQAYQVDGLQVDFLARTVTVGDSMLRLTPTEFKLLYELASSAGRVLTQNELLQRVWGPEYSGEPQLLRAYVKTLRKKLGDNARDPKYIFTEHGVGYRMPKN